MATALDVAHYFLAVAPEDGITHLKLEKLVSYAQAVCLAYLGQPLFQEDIEAWKLGPVVRSVFDEFKSNGKAPIPAKFSEHQAREAFTDEQKFVLELVAGHYGVYEAWALVEKSHREFPGIFGSGDVILKETIASAFENSRLVMKLKGAATRIDAPMGITVSGKEILDALAY